MRTATRDRRAADETMRVLLFTDTLGDINGVSRFIRTVAEHAERGGRELHVITSTAFDTPDGVNIHNFRPRMSMAMPRYEQIGLVLPPVMAMLRFARRFEPDVVHISTPGPIGATGLLAARRLGVPVLGVYHTDFPAYLDHLFDDRALTWIAGRAMRRFYKNFTRIFTRSDEYAQSLVALGLVAERIVRLRPGIETAQFQPALRDEGIWARLDRESSGTAGRLDRDSVKVLSVGRVSVEKNLPLLARAWLGVRRRLQDRGVVADLVVVGDGPYRGAMEEQLAGEDAHFLGFRQGEELSAIYASSDLFVFPSTTDTLGQVVMEAQASGLAVLVSDQGGPKEMVRPGETGLVLAGSDVRAWEDAIVNLVQDAAQRKAMGEQGAQAMVQYDISHSFDHFWEVHSTVWRDE